MPLQSNRLPYFVCAEYSCRIVIRAIAWRQPPHLLGTSTTCREAIFILALQGETESDVV